MPLSMLKCSTLALTLAFAGAAAPGLVSAAPLQAPDDTGATYKKLADQVGPALVTVKYILKIEGGGQFGEMMGGEDGRETEMTGLMIQADGLVLCSNTKMGGFASMMRGGGININPTDIKVLSGDDTEGLKAKILARDSDLDLCWVQINDDKAKGKTFPFMDLKNSAPAALGDKVFTVQREGKFFDHALVVNEGRVGGTTRKPRPLIVPAGLGLDLGMPVVSGDGKLVGIGVLQMPNREDAEGGDMSGLFDGGLGGGGGMVLPAEEVFKATERGKAMPQKDAEKPDAKKDEKSSGAGGDKK